MPTEQEHISSCEGKGVEIVSQSIREKPPWALAHRDINILFSLLTLSPIALIGHERYWRSICDALAHLTLFGRLGRRRRNSIEQHLSIAFLNYCGPFYAVCRELEAHQLELRLQILRTLFVHNWQPQIDIRGVSHIEAALAAGRGTILWISRFAFADTIGKIGLHMAGYPVVHLSRSIHGFSTTRFGRRWLNPIYRRAENRYLTERVTLQEDAPAVALRRLRNALANNGVVSITVYSWGAQVVEAPFLGGRIRIGTGAPGLAWKTGARLLPVLVIQDPQTGQFGVFIDEPLVVDQSSPKGEAEKGVVTDYLSQLQPHVLAYPGQWLEWQNLRVAVGDQQPARSVTDTTTRDVRLME